MLENVWENLLKFAEGSQLWITTCRAHRQEMITRKLGIPRSGSVFIRGVPAGVFASLPRVQCTTLVGFMIKALYSLKLWMFRSQFEMRPKEVKGLRDFCIFSFCLYLKAWMMAPLAAPAPQTDLCILKAPVDYETVHPAIARAASFKMAKSVRGPGRSITVNFDVTEINYMATILLQALKIKPVVSFGVWNVNTQH